jgi:hypothetical protein
LKRGQADDDVVAVVAVIADVADVRVLRQPMSTIDTILTHPGGAHKDDLLAVCVLIAKHGAPVVRRDPTDDELANPRIAIVDVGGSHDPSKSNFDHHHFPREHPPTCALSLVLQDLGVYDEARHLCPWLEPAEWFDSRGPKKTAAFLGVPRKAISQLNSPVDLTILRRFAQSATLAPGEPLYEVMRFIGQDLLDYLHVARERIAFVAAHAKRWTLEHNGETIEAVFLPRTEASTEEPSVAVENYVRAMGLDEVVQVIVYPDRRGTGYGIGRYEDHPRFDFARLQAEPDVHFAHTSGFMC